MTRRVVVIVATFAAAAGALVLTSTAASAQVGLPGFDIAALLRSIFESLLPLFQSIFGPIFNALLSSFGGGCIPPLCASP